MSVNDSRDLQIKSESGASSESIWAAIPLLPPTLSFRWYHPACTRASTNSIALFYGGATTPTKQELSRELTSLVTTFLLRCWATRDPCDAWYLTWQHILPHLEFLHEWTNSWTNAGVYVRKIWRCNISAPAPYVCCHLNNFRLTNKSLERYLQQGVE